MATTAAVLQAAYDNYARILLLCTTAIAYPTTENIDAVTTAADDAKIIRPKVTYTVDGRQFAWTEYQQFLTTQLAAIKSLITDAEGPFEIRTRATT